MFPFAGSREICTFLPDSRGDMELDTEGLNQLDKCFKPFCCLGISNLGIKKAKTDSLRIGCPTTEFGVQLL